MTTLLKSSENQGGGLFRMEKSVLTKSNFTDLAAISSDSIPEALLEYICYEHQYNIFGYGILDPAEFAGKFKFSKQYLFDRHPEPYQKTLRKLANDTTQPNRRLRIYSGDTTCSDIICANRIENAFFILANFPLNVTSTAVLEDKTLIRQYGSLRVLEQFAIHQDSRTGKVRYTYKLDDKFRRNLSSMYLTTRLDSLAALRKSGLGILYVFLLKLRDALFYEGKTQTEVSSTPEFEYLCSLADIPNYPEPKYRKRDLNKALKRISEETELDFTLCWVRGNGTERYVPIFNFNSAGNSDAGISNERFVKVCRERERIDVAVHEFVHNLVDVCPFTGDRSSKNAETFFYEWIRLPDPDSDLLMRYALEKTFVNLGCGIPHDIPERIKLFRFYADRRSRSDFWVWVREIFTGSHGFSVPVFRCIDQRHGR